MKTLLLGFIFIALVYTELPAQHDSTHAQDTLTWYVYIGGKSDGTRREAEKKIAAQWGITMEYSFGDCMGTYDHKIEECEKKNQSLFSYLSEKYGENWQHVFNEKVDAEWQQLHAPKE